MPKLVQTGMRPEALHFDPVAGSVRLDPQAETYCVRHASKAPQTIHMTADCPGALETTVRVRSISQYAMLLDSCGQPCSIDLAVLEDGSDLFLLSEDLIPDQPYDIVENNHGEHYCKPLACGDRSGAGIVGGTIMQTPMGDVPVEWLRPGDKVLTRENGFRTVEAIRRSVLTPSDIADARGGCPIVIMQGALDGIHPLTTMRVAPETHILLRSALAELYFGSNEVLVRAAALIGREGILTSLPASPLPVSRLIMEQCELVAADGWWIESDAAHGDNQIPASHRVLTEREARLLATGRRRRHPRTALAS